MAEQLSHVAVVFRVLENASDVIKLLSNNFFARQSHTVVMVFWHRRLEVEACANKLLKKAFPRAVSEGYALFLVCITLASNMFVTMQILNARLETMRKES